MTEVDQLIFGCVSGLLIGGVWPPMWNTDRKLSTISILIEYHEKLEQYERVKELTELYEKTEGEES